MAEVNIEFRKILLARLRFREDLLDFFINVLNDDKLIYDGTAQRPARNKAAVSLQYANFRILTHESDVCRAPQGVHSPRTEIIFKLPLETLQHEVHDKSRLLLVFLIPIVDRKLVLRAGDEIKMKIVADRLPNHPIIKQNGQIYKGLKFAQMGGGGTDVVEELTRIVEYIVVELSSDNKNAERITIDRNSLVPQQNSDGTLTSNNLFEEFRTFWEKEPHDKLPSIPPTEHMRLLSNMERVDNCVFKEIFSDELVLPEFYDNSCLLGSGAFGTVLLGTVKASSLQVALKIATDDSKRDLLMLEAHYLTMLNHKNIVKCIGAGDMDSFGFCIVLEKWTTDLETVITDKSRGDFIYYIDHVFSWMHQIVEGLHYLHSQAILHRDIKPANILIRSLDPGFDGRSTVAIADMGIANDIDEFRATAIGTPGYAAPEVWNNGVQTTAVDVFSTGLIYYDLIRGEQRETKAETTLFAHAESRPNVFHFDDEIMRMIERCWQHDPTARPSTTELIAHLKERWKAYHLLSPEAHMTRDFLYRLNLRRIIISQSLNPPLHVRTSYKNAILDKLQSPTIPRTELELSLEDAVELQEECFRKMFKPKRKDNTQYVIKFPQGNEYDRELMMLECFTFLQLNEHCEYFAKCHGIHETENHFGFVLEYSDHGTMLELFCYLMEDLVPLLSAGHIGSWMFQAFSALDFLASIKYWIGSIGPHTFLLTGEGQTIKLCDLSTFHNVQISEEADDDNSKHRRRFRRPPPKEDSKYYKYELIPRGPYAAPEVVKEDVSTMGLPSDIYSAAAVFRELLLLSANHASTSYSDLLAKCMLPAPNLRPSAADMKEMLESQEHNVVEPLILLQSKATA